MENYLPNDVLGRALTEMRLRLPASFGKFSRVGDAAQRIDKMRLAELVTASPPRSEYLDVLDLRERMEELVAYIDESRRSSGRGSRT